MHRLLLVVLAGCATTRAQTYVECRVATADAVVRPRQPIRATVTLTNRAAMPITIVRRLERTSYEPPTTADLFELSRGASWTTTIDVIESATGNLDLVGRPVLFDDGRLLREMLDEPGRHVLELWVHAYTGRWSTTCNPIEVEVRPEVI
jgi:hypothetical protein